MTRPTEEFADASQDDALIQQTDNTERPGIDPEQDVSQDPNIEYSDDDQEED